MLNLVTAFGKKLTSLFRLREEPKREVDLDFVRTIAILLAVGWHFNHHFSGNRLVVALLWPGAQFGWAGVDLFFVLSGFLIGRIVLAETKNTGTFDVKRFYVRRFFKLWPVLYFFLAIMLVGSGRPASEFLPQISLHVQNYWPPSLAHHLWSLAVEEHFYVLISVLLIACIKFKSQDILIPIVCICLLFVGLALRLISAQYGVSSVALQWQSQYRVDALAFGLLLGWTLVYREELFTRLLEFRRVWAVVAVAGVAVLATNEKDGLFGSTFGFTIAYISAGAFLMSVYRSGLFKRTGWFARICVSISMMSYAIYIWHPTVGKAVDQAAKRFPFLDSEGVVVALSYAVSLAVGFAATVLIEQPFLKLRERCFPTLVRTTTSIIDKTGSEYRNGS